MTPSDQMELAAELLEVLKKHQARGVPMADLVSSAFGWAIGAAAGCFDMSPVEIAEHARKTAEAVHEQMQRTSNLEPRTSTRAR